MPNNEHTCILFGISSYHRSNRLKTLRMLLEWNIQPEDIAIQLNDLADMKKYKPYEKYGKILLNEGKGAGFNRNRIIDYGKQNGRNRILLLDDDLISVDTFEDRRKLARLNKDEALKRFNEAFLTIEKIGAAMFTTYPVDNARFMYDTAKRQGRHSFQQLAQGGLIGVLADRVEYFDEQIPLLEDYEWILRHISHNKGVMRLNNLSVNKSANEKTPGGLHDTYQLGQKAHCMMILAARYKKLVKIKKDKSGLIMR